jgi:hypothetical protein
MTALVVADRLYVHAAAFRQGANRQVVAHIYLSLDSVPWYGL